MTDIATDVISMYKLLDTATAELKNTKPDHELLRFAAFATETGGMPASVGDEYLDRFAPDKNTKAYEARLNYLHAVNEALKEPVHAQA